MRPPPTFARIFAVSLLLLAVVACGRNEAPPKQTNVEPTEAEMRAAQVAVLEAFNPVGGVKLQDAEGVEKRVKIKVESVEKLGCKPGLREVWYCTARVTTSFPGSDQEDSTAVVNDWYGRTVTGRWVLNPPH
jgi:hypothetical protein